MLIIIVAIVVLVVILIEILIEGYAKHPRMGCHYLWRFQVLKIVQPLMFESCWE